MTEHQHDHDQECLECSGGKDAFREKVMDDIHNGPGHSVICVFDSDPPFAYTVGRAINGEPELYISGLDPDTSVRILNLLIIHKDEQELDLAEMAMNGELIDEVLDDYSLKLIACDAIKAEAFSASILGINSVDMLQVVWPDKDGHFPGDPEYSLPPGIQEIHAK